MHVARARTREQISSMLMLPVQTIFPRLFQLVNVLQSATLSAVGELRKAALAKRREETAQARMAAFGPRDAAEAASMAAQGVGGACTPLFRFPATATAR